MGITLFLALSVVYTVGMTEIDYEDRYRALVKVFKEEVIMHKESKDRGLTQLRHQMVANSQLHRELDEARLLIDGLLHGDNKVVEDRYVV